MTINVRHRKIYYLPVVQGDFDYGAVELNASQRSNPKPSSPPFSFLLSYDLEAGKIEDLGRLKTSDDGSWAYGMGAAEADAEGRLWFVGAFEEKDDKYVVRKMRGVYPYSLGLGCYQPMSESKNAK